MYSILLLFTFVACSILAVSPVPVPGPSDQAPAWLLSLGHPDPTVTITITFIHGTTGKDLGDRDQKTVFDVHATQSLFTTIIKGLFGLKGKKCEITYIGSCSPRSPMDRRWVYFKVAGVDQCKEQPCFGWLAKGRADPTQHVSLVNIFATPYVGISLGEPRAGEFVAFKGRPDARPDQKAFSQAQQNEWNTIVQEFQAHFMIPHALPPVPPMPLSPPVPPPKKILIVTFISGDTGEDLGKTGTIFRVHTTASALTTMILGIFGLNSKTSEITYIGLYSPEQVDRKWLFIKVTGVASVRRYYHVLDG
ncbi:hypothetical protein BDP27DRAFT_273781 [Rhodocollybia butyracea]|uniref:PLAT domain-containing protein n=1 Tax=Rhodocollybia butyracea TaxID=206335 RepID=A0A9P5U1V5_9AGAR|nr:hypothetical protein BDP27DRAFT_273781 [Rhodocollybia butyracea]